MADVYAMNRFIFIFFLVCTISLGATDTIPVYEEPHHHLVYSNGEIRILDVRLQPGDTSAWHRHRHAITYIGLEGSRIWLDVPGEHPRSVYLPDDFWGGDTEYPEIPFTHRIANVGFQPFRLLAVEHLNPRKEIQIDETELDGWESLDVNPYFILHKLTVDPGQTKTNLFSGPGLLICRGKSQLLLSQAGTIAAFQQGDWQYWPVGTVEVGLTNPGDEPMEVLLLHL